MIKALQKNSKIAAFFNNIFPILIFFSIIAAYIPYFLAVFPGIYSYDASNQLAMFYLNEPFTLHHPIAHTLFLYGCIHLGQLIWHSGQAGMVLHSIVQSSIVALGFTYLITRMKKRQDPILVIIAAWTYLVANPYITIFSFITTKDVIFSVFFLLVFEQTRDLCNHPEIIQNKIFFIPYALSIIGMCLFRNQAIYVYALFAFIFVIYLLFQRITAKKKIISCFLMISAVSLCSAHIIGTVLPLKVGIRINEQKNSNQKGVTKGDMREALSVPMQQIAYVYNYHPEVMTSDEKQYVETLIHPKNLKQYIPRISDPVKSGFRTNVLQKNPKKFICVYCALGQKDPAGYQKAFYDISNGNWNLSKVVYWDKYIYFNDLDNVSEGLEHKILHIKRRSRLPQFQKDLRYIMIKPRFKNVPILKYILNQAFAFWVAVVAEVIGLICLCRKNILKECKESIVPLTLFFGYFITLMLGPVVGIRYALPLMYCVPSMIAMSIKNLKYLFSKA